MLSWFAFQEKNCISSFCADVGEGTSTALVGGRLSLYTYFYCQVNVKWGKEKYDNVEIDTSEPPLVFKSQLFALTRVPPDRQKSKCPARNQKNIYLVLR